MFKLSINNLMLCFLCATGFFIFSGCETTGSPFNSIPAGALEPPIYPGAQHVQSTAKVFINCDNGSNSCGHATAKIVTFLTADKPEAVMEFYVDTLFKQGWGVYPKETREELATAITSTTDYLMLTSVFGCPEYYFEIKITRNPQGTLWRVQLEPSQLFCP